MNIYDNFFIGNHLFLFETTHGKICTPSLLISCYFYFLWISIYTLCAYYYLKSIKTGTAAIIFAKNITEYTFLI